MKKIFYSFAILSLLFTACNPMEDIYTEIDSQESIISGEATITLSDADYDDLDLGFGNFSTLDDAKSMLPDFLAGKYPAWGKESLAAVTFKLYSPKSTESSLVVYTVSSADYAAGGFTFGNFSNPSDITGFLETKYPNAANRLLVSLTYKYYSGSVSTLNNGFLRVNGAWEMASGISDAEYTAMGEGFSNFSNTNEALTKIPVFLADKFKYDGKKEGDIVAIMYKLYVSGSVRSYIGNFIYNGASWSVYNNVINETIKFGHDGTKWVPDNTIKYTLTIADYTLVGNGRYNNFDVRVGKVEEPESVRVDKVNTILLNNFPSDAEGQKYIVSYNIYNGANGVWSLAVVKVGSAYVKQ
jgi:hypothetical protein